MVREEYHTVVIGASVAGLFAAYQLARAGVRVRVYEAQAELAPPARTLIVTPACLDLLDFDIVEAVLNRTRTFELISAGRSARITLQEPDLIVERGELVRVLARQVRRAGGEIVLNHRLEEVSNHSPALRLHFQNSEGIKTVRAATVVGADGIDSITARSVGRDGFERVGLIQARVALPPDLSPDTVRVWFDRESTRFFYWLIPESAQTGVAGLIADTPEAAQTALKQFLRSQDLAPIAYEEDAPVPISPLRLGSQGDGRIFLAGDAAAQVKVTTVGGVVTGLQGAAAAARSILRGTAYADELASLHWELNVHALARKVLDGFTDGDYDRLLELLNRRGVDVLSRYNRDELGRGIWRLMPVQPRWLLLGARALARRLVGGRRA